MQTAVRAKRVNRQTVDLAAYPDLVVIYLGMRVNALHGLKTLLGFGPQIQDAAGKRPEGLLRHENLLYGLVPPHAGMRQYWRDWPTLEAWTRSEPHRRWWKAFLRDSGGTGFWHETYFLRGGMEAIYDDVVRPVGMMHFAPLTPARGGLFSARRRLGLGGAPVSAPVLAEDELYARDPATSR
jgi:hypothetical protein